MTSSGDAEGGETMGTYAMVVDYKYCTGCHTCEIACRNEKGLALDEWGIKLSEQGPVRIDGKWMWNYVPIPSDACDLCRERIDAGKKPSCEHHCLAQCLQVVPIEHVGEAASALGNGVAVFIPGDQGF